MAQPCNSNSERIGYGRTRMRPTEPHWEGECRRTEHSKSEKDAPNAPWVAASQLRKANWVLCQGPCPPPTGTALNVFVVPRCAFVARTEPSSTRSCGSVGMVHAPTEPAPYPFGYWSQVASFVVATYQRPVLVAGALAPGTKTSFFPPARESGATKTTCVVMCCVMFL